MPVRSLRRDQTHPCLSYTQFKVTDTVSARTRVSLDDKQG